MLTASSSAPEKEGKGEPALNCGRSTARAWARLHTTSQSAEHRAQEVQRPASSHARPPVTCRNRAGLIAGPALAKRTVTGHVRASADRAGRTGHLTGGHRPAGGEGKSIDRFPGSACRVMIAAGGRSQKARWAHGRGEQVISAGRSPRGDRDRVSRRRGSPFRRPGIAASRAADPDPALKHADRRIPARRPARTGCQLASANPKGTSNG